MKRDLEGVVLQILMKKEGNKTRYSIIYSELKEILKTSIPSRDFGIALTQMVNKKILAKHDSMKRGTKVYYELTKHGRAVKKAEILNEIQKLSKLASLLGKRTGISTKVNKSLL